MAGRGRGATLPAWMTLEASAAPSVTANLQHQFLDAPPPPGDDGFSSREGADPVHDDRNGADHRSNGGSERDRERDKDYRGRVRSDSRDRRRTSSRRSRSRSRSRGKRSDRDSDRRRDRSASPDAPVRPWKSRGNRKSNFDVPPPDGIELPGVGSGLSTGAGHGAAINQIANRYGGSVPTPGDFNSISMQQTKHARRLYVGGIPPETAEDELSHFLLDIIQRAISRDLLEPGTNPIISTYINHEKCFAFVELTTIDLTTACLGFDGIKYPHRGGVATLRVRRPNDFKPELLPPSTGLPPPANLNALGIIGTTVQDGPGKVFIGGLPYTLADEDVKELLSAFGPLRAFHLVRDAGSVTSKGYAFCEYQDMNITNQAIEGLNGMQIGDKTLTVRVATQSQSQLQTPAVNLGAGLGGMGMSMGMVMGGFGQNLGGFGAGTLGVGVGMGGQSMPGMSTFYPPQKPHFSQMPPTRVLKLSNMVNREDLMDDLEFEDIREDVRQECSDHGHVLNVLIPRGKDGFPAVCEGSIFVHFAEPNMAQAAASSLSGRKFAERVVVVDYYDEGRFLARDLLQ